MKTSDSRPRVLQIIPNLGVGGAQKAFSDYSKVLSNTCNVHEIYYSSSPEQDFYPSGCFQYQLRLHRIFSIFGPVSRLIGRALLLRSLVIENKYEYVISHMDGSNWVNALSFSPARKIFVVQGSLREDRQVSNVTQFLRRFFLIPVLYRLAFKVIAVSNGIKKELNFFYGIHNVVVVYNSFDVAFIRQQSKAPLAKDEEELMDHSTILISSARFHPQKNHSFLLELFAYYRASNPIHSVKLFLLGDGYLREGLLTLCEQLDLAAWTVWSNEPISSENDVFFFGAIDNPFPYIVKADIFLMPSLWEGFPLALCEAVLCEVPIIAFNCPTGPSEIFSLANNLKSPKNISSSVHLYGNGILLDRVDNNLADIDNWVKAITLVEANALSNHSLRQASTDLSTRVNYSSMERSLLNLMN